MSEEKEDNPMMGVVPFLIILVLVITILFIFVGSQMNGAAKWSDFYVKELTKTINMAQPGDKIELDVHHATTIAKKSDQFDLQQIFQFNNNESEVCVSLNPDRKVCHYYFSNVSVESNLILGAFTSTEKNTLVLEIKERKPEANDE